jgi:putative acetyltransferase
VSVEIRCMIPEHYDDVLSLWRRSPGVGLNESDTREAVGAFLARNPGMSAVALAGQGVVGAVLCGHDGRRGYLHHLAVDEGRRGEGIGAALFAWCMSRLEEARIPKCNVFLYADNESGAGFWEHHGFAWRADLRVLQRHVSAAAASTRGAPRRAT